MDVGWGVVASRIVAPLGGIVGRRGTRNGGVAGIEGFALVACTIREVDGAMVSDDALRDQARSQSHVCLNGRVVDVEWGGTFGIIFHSVEGWGSETRDDWDSHADYPSAMCLLRGK